MKGYVDLSKVKVIEKVLDGAFDKPSFQVSVPYTNGVPTVQRGFPSHRVWYLFRLILL